MSYEHTELKEIQTVTHCTNTSEQGENHEATFIKC